MRSFRRGLGSGAGRAVPAENSEPSGSAAGGVTLSKPPEGELVTESKKPPVDLTAEQRQKVITEVVARNSRQATPKEFKPELGAAVTRFVDIHAMPPALNNDVPALKNYMYAHLDRTIVIVDALNKNIVALIPLPENLAQESDKEVKVTALDTVGGLGGLKPEQLRALYQSAGGETQPVPQQALLAGADVPDSITLQPLAPDAAAQAPQLHGLHYAKLQDGRMLLVDPNKRKVAGIITQDEGTSTAAAGAATTGTGDKGAGSGEPTADPLREREESGKPSAYTGPTTTGPNTD